MLNPTLNSFNYIYPENLVAQAPVSPRDSAKLLIYNRSTRQIIQTQFKHLPKYLPKSSVLVFNETQVIPARFFVSKPTGGKVELLYLNHTPSHFTALANKPLKPGTTLTHSSLQFIVIKKLTKGYSFQVNLSMPQFLIWLQTHGLTPIPPYIKNTPLSEKKLQKEYQSIFAKHPGSSAAPTASLHFTQRLTNQLLAQGHKIEKITLHVGLGTFAPLTEENLNTQKLHSEFYEISAPTAKRLNRFKLQGIPIIAVGTTVVRTLESASNPKGLLTRLTGHTSLFIQEDYQFKFINNLITNFHVPQSSLLMLVSALTGRQQLLKLYEHAIQNKYRLFSFGDGMLIL